MLRVVSMLALASPAASQVNFWCGFVCSRKLSGMAKNEDENNRNWGCIPGPLSSVTGDVDFPFKQCTLNEAFIQIIGLEIHSML